MVICPDVSRCHGCVLTICFFLGRAKFGEKISTKITQAVPSVNNVRAMVETASEEAWETKNTLVSVDLT